MVKSFLMKKIFLSAIVLLFSALFFAQDIKPNPWSLIIFRPDNIGAMNDVRCWIKLEDAETGEDVTFTKASAKYEWIWETITVDKKNPKSLAALFKPNRIVNFHEYKRTWYLSGGMAMHLNLKPGKYKISFYTPKDKTNLYPCDNKEDWISNIFTYDTTNPTNVIFLKPTMNDNGFYNGGWFISPYAQ